MRNWLQSLTPLTAFLFILAACGESDPDEFSSFGLELTQKSIVSVTASAHDGNVPDNAIDGRMDTRWSASGAGSWIQARLDARSTIEAVEIAWYRGNERQNDFSILADGREVFRGRSSGRTQDFERYTFSGVEARDVRIVFHGNTQNQWASISELRILGGEAAAPTTPTPRSVTASSHDGNVPANAIDGNLDTRWSCSGNCYLQLDFGEAIDVAGVKIAWHRGDERTIDFRVQLSTDGRSFNEAYSGRSSGRTRDFETFSFSPAKARYVRVASNGNSDNAWNSISEIQVLSTGAGSDPGQPGGDDEGPIEIVAVSASADDGNVPENVLDGDPNTRWSCQGDCYLDLDLGTRRSFDGVRVAWHRGDERTTSFRIGVSDDGRRFTTAFQGRSSGRTTGFENYVFQSTQRARFVRISASGSSMNAWNSITRVEIIPVGGADDLPKEPEQPEEPQQPGNPGNGGDLDRFGVKMLYPSKPGGEEWFLGNDPNRDPRFDPQNTVTRNSDGSWKMRSSKVRMNVFTSSGYSSSRIRSYNRDTLTRQGYMQDERDWRNVEITGYVKVNRASDRSDNLTWYTRGGRHSSSRPCEGSAMKGSLHYNGRTRVQKESYHVSYTQSPYRNTTSSIIGRWVGMKVVIRNVTVSGRTAVRTEIYLDEKGDGKSWELAYEHTDSGNFGGSLGSCGGSDSRMPITWGGPVAAFRWDNAEDVDFKWLSVREIIP